MGSELSIRARLRSLAVLEPFARARAELVRGPASNPVVSLPSPSQLTLESLVFGHLRYLYDPSRSSRESRTRFAPIRIDAGENHLTVMADPYGLAEKLSFDLLPEWEEGDEVIANGIPGLRYRPSHGRQGVTFYFPTSVGAISFTGITVREFDAVRSARLLDASMRSVTLDQPLTAQERRSWSPHRAKGEAASIVARRLGLFIAADPIAIDSWWNRPGRFSVELIVDESAPDPMPTLLTRLQSTEFAPQLRVKEEYVPGMYNVHLQVDGSQSELDLRMLRVRGSTRRKSSAIGRG